MLVLVLHLALGAGEPIRPTQSAPRLIDLGANLPRAVTLLAQSAPPLATPEALQTADLAAEIAALNKRIMAIDVNWPTGAVIAGYAGGVMLYVTLIVATAALVVTRGASPVPLAVIIGMGVAGAGLVVGAWVAGSTAAASAREQRDSLIKERDLLKQHLKEQGDTVPFVNRQTPEVTPLVTVAEF